MPSEKVDIGATRRMNGMDATSAIGSYVEIVITKGNGRNTRYVISEGAAAVLRDELVGLLDSEAA